MEPSAPFPYRSERFYQDETNRRLDLDRVMACHILTVLGDVLGRSEAGVALPGGGDPSRPAS